jgi:hypothetical protein
MHDGNALKEAEAARYLSVCFGLIPAPSQVKLKASIYDTGPQIRTDWALGPLHPFRSRQVPC